MEKSNFNCPPEHEIPGPPPAGAAVVAAGVGACVGLGVGAGVELGAGAGVTPGPPPSQYSLAPREHAVSAIQS